MPSLCFLFLIHHFAFYLHTCALWMHRAFLCIENTTIHTVKWTFRRISFLSEEADREGKEEKKLSFPHENKNYTDPFIHSLIHILFFQLFFISAQCLIDFIVLYAIEFRKLHFFREMLKKKAIDNDNFLLYGERASEGSSSLQLFRLVFFVLREPNQHAKSQVKS
jgi:hypothetical protein